MTAICTPIPVGAYDLETTLSLSETEFDSNPTYNLGVRYYFSPISHGSSTPWDEISFVERIGFMEGEASYSKQSHSIGAFPNIKLDRKIESVGGELVFRQPNSPHSFAFGAANSKLTTDDVRISWTGFPSRPGDIEVTERSVESYALSASYDYYFERLWTGGVNVFYDDGFHGLESYGAALATERLWDLGTGGWLGLGASVGYSERESIVGSLEGDSHNSLLYTVGRWTGELNGRYYFNVKTKIDAAVAVDNLNRNRTYSLGFSRYLNDFLFIRIQGILTEYNPPSSYPPEIINRINDEWTAWRVSFGGRF